MKKNKSFEIYVPLEYKSDYLERLPEEKSIIIYNEISRKNSDAEDITIGELVKSEVTYKSKVLSTLNQEDP